MKDLNNQEIEIWHFKWLAQGYVICKQQGGGGVIWVFPALVVYCSSSGHEQMVFQDPKSSEY